tara:strand:- start:483 stop:1079 length:597 start_codon:yes stop_codon:yes gene_type:complete
MPLTKTQAEGINLADTFAFTGTVTGAGGLVSATEVDASGTQVDFTSIPDGVKHIKVIGQGLSISSGSGTPNSFFVMRIGSNNTIETSGYDGCWLGQNSAGSDGVVYEISASTSSVNGVWWVLTRATGTNSHMNFMADLRLVDDDAYLWTYSFISNNDSARDLIIGSGSKTLSARLDRLAVGTYSGYTLDAGKVVIQYA